MGSYIPVAMVDDSSIVGNTVLLVGMTQCRVKGVVEGEAIRSMISVVYGVFSHFSVVNEWPYMALCL